MSLFKKRKEIKPSDVTKLNLSPGDILWVKLGFADLGDGGPWIPTDEDIKHTTEDWSKTLPKGVKLIVTHPGVEISGISWNL